MNEEFVIALGMDALWTGLKIGAPVLGVAMVVGLVMSVIQAVTQVQEATLGFVPKAIAMIAVVALAGPWMLNTLLTYTAMIFSSLPSMAR